LQHLRWLATDELSNDSSAEWREPALTAQTVAFLQYTSGSTRTPRGVVLTHENVLFNAALIKRLFRNVAQSESRLLMLPFYHDMGLIGGSSRRSSAPQSTTLMATAHVFAVPHPMA